MPSLWTFRKRRADTPSSEQEKRDSSRRTPTRRLSKRRKPNRTPTPPHRIVSENPPYLPTPPTSSHGDAIEIIPQLDSSSERSRSREIVEDQAVTPPNRFAPKKQQREGYQSYFTEQTHFPHSPSSSQPLSASQRPQSIASISSSHRDNNTIVLINPSTRSQEKRGSSPSAAKAPAKRELQDNNDIDTSSSPKTGHHRKRFSFVRFGSLRDRKKNEKKSKETKIPAAESRFSPESDMSYRRGHSRTSSRSSHMAAKVRAIDVLSPHPNIRFSFEVNPFGPSLSRTTSNAKGKKRDVHELIKNPNGKVYVESIADELDARGIREAMDRDRRRREAKKGKASRRDRSREQKSEKPAHHRQSKAQRQLEETLLRTRAAIAQASQDNLRGNFFRDDHIPSGPPYDKDSRMSTGTRSPLTWLNDASDNEDLPGTARPTRVDTRFEFDELRHGHRRTVSDETYSSENSAVYDNQRNSYGAFNGGWTRYPMQETEEERVAKSRISMAIKTGESALFSDSEGEMDTQESNRRENIGMAIGAEEDVIYRTYSSDEESRLRAGRADDYFDGFVDDTYGTYEGESAQPGPSYEQTFQYDQPRSSSGSLPHHDFLSPNHGNGRYGELHFEEPVRQSGYHTASSVAYHHSTRMSQDVPSTFSRPSSKQRSGAVSPDDGFGTQSLASIDSEGSWFGAGRSKRMSSRTYNPASMRTSTASIHQRFSEFEGFEGQASPTKTDSPHLGRYSSMSERSYDEGVRTRMELSDVEDEDEVAGGDKHEENVLLRDHIVKVPTVHESPGFERSREGLLREFDDEGRSNRASYHSQMMAETQAQGYHPEEQENRYPMSQAQTAMSTPHRTYHNAPVRKFPFLQGQHGINHQEADSQMSTPGSYRFI